MKCVVGCAGDAPAADKEAEAGEDGVLLELDKVVPEEAESDDEAPAAAPGKHWQRDPKSRGRPEQMPATTVLARFFPPAIKKVLALHRTHNFFFWHTAYKCFHT